MELGIIGLSQSGKTTVFNALIRSSTGHAVNKVNFGIAKVPDSRLDQLTEMFHPKREVLAEVGFTDVPGAPEGLGKSQGISGEYLNALQRADALLHVVRAFDDPAVPHLEGSIDPYRDSVNMDLELAVSDIAIIERRLKRLDTELKGARTQDRDRVRKEADLLERLRDGLSSDIPVREHVLSAEERKLISTYQFLTEKPLFILINLGEDRIPETPDLEREFQEHLVKSGTIVAAMCARLEEELADMDPQDEEEMRQSLEAGESAATRVIQLAYELVGLVSFFTVGSDECRAWTIRKDTQAVDAAGQIHSDIARGFIRAEVVTYDELVRCGSLVEARKQAVLRHEGKTYLVKDGDIVHILNNV